MSGLCKFAYILIKSGQEIARTGTGKFCCFQWNDRIEYGLGGKLLIVLFKDSCWEGHWVSRGQIRDPVGSSINLKNGDLRLGPVWMLVSVVHRGEGHQSPAPLQREESSTRSVQSGPIQLYSLTPRTMLSGIRLNINFKNESPVKISTCGNLYLLEGDWETQLTHIKYDPHKSLIMFYDSWRSRSANGRWCVLMLIISIERATMILWLVNYHL